jgi:hypothetical protein
LSWPTDTPDPRALHSLVLDFKSGIGQYSNTGQLTHLVEYPNDPTDLPADLKASAYANDLSTVRSRDLPRWTEFINITIMRSSHRLMRGFTQLVTPMPSVNTNIPTLMLEPPMNPMHQLLQQGCNNPASSASLIGQALMHLMQQQSSGPMVEPITRVSPMTSGVSVQPSPTNSPISSTDSLTTNASHLHIMPGASPPPAVDAVRSLPAIADAPFMQSTLVEQMEQAVQLTASAIPKRMRILTKSSPSAVAAALRKRAPRSSKARSAVLKKPAGNRQSVTAKLSECPPDEAGTTYILRGGKVYISLGLKCYRVMKAKGDRSGVQVLWNSYPSRLDAWHAALGLIP